MNTKGLFIFAGITNTGEEVFEILEPQLQAKMFYYNCGKKFVTEQLEQYYDKYDGTIIFCSGDECIIYKFNGSIFEQHLRFDSRIGKKQKKGGQSAQRFGRIADGEREKYVITVIDHINKLEKNGNWIFGSQDIIDDIFQRKNQITVSLNNGGFLNFDTNTILDTNRWIAYMKSEEVNENLFSKTAELLEVSPELLEFDPAKLDDLTQFQYVIITPQHPLYNEITLPDKIIKLPVNSRFYGRLNPFVCIGKYYFGDQSATYSVEYDRRDDCDDDFM